MEGLALIRAATELTNAAVDSSALPCRGNDETFLYIGYTMGVGETNNLVQYYVDWSIDGGTTWFRDSDWHVDSDAITWGTVTVDKKLFVYGADAAAGTYDYTVISLKTKGNMVRASFYEVGVAANYGTCVAYIGFNR